MSIDARIRHQKEYPMIKGLTEYDKLPKEAQDYVEFIEKEIGVHISIVSTGPVREEIIRR